MVLKTRIHFYGKTSKISLGYILTIILFNVDLNSADGKCTNRMKKNNLKHITCTGEFKDIPRNLDNSIESLTLENSTIAQFGIDSFAIFPDLIELQILNTTVNAIYNDQYLQYLNLKNLEIIGSRIPNLVNTDFPSSLLALNISNNELSDYDPAKLVKLLKFNASRNRISDFPVFNSFGLVEYIDLDYNYNIRFPVEMIIGLCRLKLFYSNQYAYLVSNNADDYCECLLLKRWLEMQKIKTNIKKCDFPKAESTSCSLKFDSRMLEEYKICSERTVMMSDEPALNKGTLIVIIMIILIISLIVIRIISHFTFGRK